MVSASISQFPFSSRRRIRIRVSINISESMIFCVQKCKFGSIRVFTAWVIFTGLSINTSGLHRMFSKNFVGTGKNFVNNLTDFVTHTRNFATLALASVSHWLSSDRCPSESAIHKVGVEGVTAHLYNRGVHNFSTEVRFC